MARLIEEPHASSSELQTYRDYQVDDVLPCVCAYGEATGL